jgi:hypothetical protein
MQHLEGNGMPVLYTGRTVLKVKYIRLCYISALRAEPDSTKPVCSELDRAETNQGLRRQIM